MHVHHAFPDVEVNRPSRHLFVHADGILRLVHDAWLALRIVLGAAGLVGERLSGGLLAVWHGPTEINVSRVIT